MLRQLLKRRTKDLPWLDEPEAVRRLLSLAQFMDLSQDSSRGPLALLLTHQNGAVRLSAAKILGLEEPPKLPRPKLWRWRLGTILSGLALAASLGLTLAAGISAWNYRAVQTEASARNFADFWGEDAYIFADKYDKDPKIRQEVLPFLERWRDLTDEDAEEYKRLIGLLSSSVEPKADNVLEAIFKHMDFLPESAEAEELAISTLIEHKNESIWLFMRRHLLDQANNEKTLSRFKRMVEIGPKLGGDKVFQNVFYFHMDEYYERNAKIRSLVQEAVKASLDDPARAPERLARLDEVGKRYAQNPELQLWTERYLLDFLARPGVALSENEDKLAKEILNRVLEAARLDDAWRPLAFAAGQEGLLGPYNAEDVLAELDSRLKSLPPAGSELAKAARWQTDHLAAGLVSEGKRLFPDLREKLHDRRVLKFSGQERSTFKLVHLRELRAILNGLAGKNPVQREYLHRADALLGPAIKVAQRAGAPDGSSPGERAADDINEVLPSAESVFQLPSGNSFRDALKKARLLREDAKEPRLQSYTLVQIRALQKIVADFMINGQTRDLNYEDEGSEPTEGDLRPLAPYERKTMARAAETIDELADTYYPGGETAAVRKQSETPGRRMFDLKSADPRVRDAADRDLRAMLGAREELLLPLLNAATHRHPRDPEIARWVLGFLTGRLVLPDAKLDSSLVLDTWRAAAKTLAESGRPNEALAILEKALDQPSPALTTFLQERIKEETLRIIREAQAAYPGLDRKLVSLDVNLPPRWSGTGFRDRNVFTQRHLTDAHKAIRDEAGGLKTALTPQQRQALENANETLPRLLRLAQKTKIPSGFTHEERVADKVNPVLYEGYWHFYGDLWIQELRAQKLAPPGSGSVDSDRSFFARYSAEDLRKVLDFVKRFRDQGQGWEWDSAINGVKRRPFSPAERAYVEEAIRRLERILNEFYPPQPKN